MSGKDKAGMGKRKVYPPSRTTYESLGTPSSVQPPAMDRPSTARPPSVASSNRTEKLKAQGELEAKKKVLDMKKEFQDKVFSIKMAIGKLELESKNPSTTEEERTRNLELDKLRLELKMLEENFKMKEAYEQEALELQMAQIELNEDSDQDLGDDDPGDACSHMSQDSDVDSEHESDSPTRRRTRLDPTEQLAAAITRGLGKGKPADLPEFNGKAEDWPIFVNEFRRTTKEYSIGDSANLRRLRKALKGSAKDAVIGLLDEPKCVNEIIEDLCNRFGRPEFILADLIAKAKNVKSPEMNKPETIVAFGTVVRNLVARIKSLNKKKYLYDITLLHELVKKLPPPLATDWLKWLTSDNDREEDLEFFCQWIKTEMSYAERLRPPTIQDEKAEDTRSRKAKKGLGVHAAVKDNDERKSCVHCGKENHAVNKCFSFEKLNIKKRREIIAKAGACFACLKVGHRASRCTRPAGCNIDGCKSKTHHSLLHDSEYEHKDSNKSRFKKKHRNKEVAEQEQDSREDEEEPEVHISVSAVSSKQNILPIIPVIIKGPTGKKKKIHALLDTGASFCMIESSVADFLELEGRTEPLKFNVFQDKRTYSKSRKVAAKISGDFYRAPFYDLDRVHTVKYMDLPARTFDAEEFKKNNPHTKHMKAKTIRNARPQMIIGINRGGLFAARKILEPSPGAAPAAVRSLLGWYVIEDGVTAGNHFQFMQIDDHMHQDIRDFIAVENLGVKERPSNRSKEDMLALEMFEKTATYSPEKKKWTIGLPWRNEDMSLPSSYEMALSRLHGMEKKMYKNEDFKNMCHEKFDEYLNAGFLKKVTSETHETKRKWYLPWFFAFHPSKKPRLVFDGAAKAHGKSLNDFLLTGPDLLQPLSGVLLRFRRHKIAVTADIKAMFHQVQLHESDWPSQTVLYRKSPDQPLEEYEMVVLFFGAASSPSLACYVKDKNAELHEKKFPVAVKAIHKDFYMDDFLSGAESVEDATRLQQDVTYVHERGGFPLVKWNSSDVNVLNKIPEDLRATPGEISLQSKSDVEWEKTLGMLWNPKTDEFSFKLSQEKIPAELMEKHKIPTKRKVTSVVMSIFDPLGFLAVLKLKGLLLIQKIWKTGIGWDDSIDGDSYEMWTSWLMEIKTVMNLRIPRRLFPCSLKDSCDIQLHVFCDASDSAYACAAYLRVNTRGSICTPFVMGKTRIGPIKGLTIPRMELNAALIGSRLAKFIVESFAQDLPIKEKHFWTDSSTVLQWIRATDRRHQVYVANRVGEIAENTRPEDWRWVPSGENVADDATKLKNMTLSSSSRWFHGPEFLKQDPSHWPQEKLNHVNEAAEDMEKNHVNSVLVITDQVMSRGEPEYMPDAEKYSSWFRLLRATAMRFVAVRKFKKRAPEYMTTEDLRQAKLMWIAKHQQEYFPTEWRALKREGVVGRESRILKLSPAFNEDGVICLNGRLENATCDDSIKRPPILDPTDRYVRLMIEWYHCLGQHYGTERLVNEIRRTAWVINLRAAVKKCRAECLICRRNKTSPIHPEMGQLPAARVTPGEKAFNHTGVDYFGPIICKVKRSREKRYGVIFTCLATRAVHMELAETLTTTDMINALTRFIHTRGYPAHLWSDNGTNFVGAERELRENLEAWNQEHMRDELMRHGVEWHFIPPASPHMGGAWERMIRDVKRILQSLLTETYPTPETMRTFLAEVMGILNSRPLTATSADPEDPRCLTPNDLLHMTNVIGPTMPGNYTDSDTIRDTWRRSQGLADKFWKRWSREYLPWLAKRQKWHNQKKPLEAGSVVLLLDENAPRNEWKKGIVMATFPGKDGQVRSAEVKVAHADPDDPKKAVKISMYKRPVVKLCPLLD